MAWACGCDSRGNIAWRESKAEDSNLNDGPSTLSDTGKCLVKVKFLMSYVLRVLMFGCITCNNNNRCSKSNPSVMVMVVMVIV